MGNTAKGLIFDLDGTLYHLGFMELRMTLSLWRSVGFLRRLFPALNTIRAVKFSDQRELLDALYRTLAQMTGRSISDAGSWYQDQFMKTFVDMLQKCAAARPRIDDALIHLRNSGIRTAVVSDFSHVDERLRAIGLDAALFDYVSCSEHAGALKPHPAAMMAVAEAWEMSPDSITVIGDRDDRDGEGARQAGMGFIGITENKQSANFYVWNDALMEIARRTNVELNV